MIKKLNKKTRSEWNQLVLKVKNPIIFTEGRLTVSSQKPHAIKKCIVFWEMKLKKYLIMMRKKDWKIKRGRGVNNAIDQQGSEQLHVVVVLHLTHQKRDAINQKYQLCTVPNNQAIFSFINNVQFMRHLFTLKRYRNFCF